MQTLASGSADADRLIGELPVVVWLVHGIHGNEITSSDAALAEAYHLLAARGNADTDLTLKEALVIIDPMQNPDGRQRFVTQNLLGRAVEADPNPQSAEHDEPWPGGRSNHYLFDMNRDYFALSQKETQGRARVDARMVPAGRRRSARDGRKLDLLLRAAGRSLQSSDYTRGRRNCSICSDGPMPAPSTGRGSPTSCAIRMTRSTRGMGIRGRFPRLDCHDLRAGVTARPGVQPR